MNIPYLETVYKRVDFERDLVFMFFTIFSFFEYALKTAGYSTLQSGFIKADWRRFANTIHPHFDKKSSEELESATGYLITNPVKMQTIRNGSIDFVDNVRPIGINDTEWLSLIIRGVRNNLFHGGKFNYLRPRDTDLISNSLIVLEAWSQLDVGVITQLNNVR